MTAPTAKIAAIVQPQSLKQKSPLESLSSLSPGFPGPYPHFLQQ